jgi:hypothetical protein
MTTNTDELETAFDAALTGARLRYRAGDLRTSFALLERAHVLGQRRLGRHLRVHGWMLKVGWALRDWREVRGQLLRLALTPLGHLTGRLPIGNTGGANVSAFASMPIPDELRALLDSASIEPERARPRRNLRTAAALLLIVFASLALFLNHMGVFDGKGHRDAPQMRR